MLTVHAIGWNRRKHDGLHLALSNRYVKVLTILLRINLVQDGKGNCLFAFLLKTVRKAEAESQRLENLSRELGCPENMVQQWVHDVRQWATDGTVLTL